MCGIAGVVCLDGEASSPTQLQTVRRMISVQAHRGPDGQAFKSDSAVSLGACRLRIHDLSDAGDMPLVDRSSGNLIVFNGEIYNFKELKSTIRDYKYISGTDTEVVLAAYSKWGDSCVEHIDGMFAFAIWDSAEKTIFCARDRLGIKPFFFSLIGREFWFASEIKGLLAAGVSPSPDNQVVADYLKWGVYDHSERTFFRDVRQLKPGYTLSSHNGTIVERKYWSLEHDLVDSEPEDELENCSTGQASAKFRTLIEGSVHTHLDSEAPVALNLSGGFDSTALALLVSNASQHRNVKKAYNFFFGSPEFDENRQVELTTKRLGWDVDYCYVSAASIPQLATECLFYQEQPYPGLPTIGKHELCKLARSQGSVVVLEGQGGDEVGAGYQHMFACHILDLLKKGSNKSAEKEVRRFAAINSFSLGVAQKILFGGISSYWRSGFSADGSKIGRSGVFKEEFLENNGSESMEFQAPFESFLRNMQYRDIAFSKLPRILRSCDRASMAHSVELRVPFLDHRIVEHGIRVRGEEKIRDGVQRWYMRRSFEGRRNSELLSEPKRAIVDPQRQWLKDELTEWVSDIFHSNSFRERPYFNAGAVQKQYDSYKRESEPENSVFIWQAIMMELWSQQFLDNPL